MYLNIEQNRMNERGDKFLNFIFSVSTSSFLLTFSLSCLTFNNKILFYFLGNFSKLSEREGKNSERKKKTQSENFISVYKEKKKCNKRITTFFLHQNNNYERNSRRRKTNEQK